MRYRKTCSGEVRVDEERGGVVCCGRLWAFPERSALRALRLRLGRRQRLLSGGAQAMNKPKTSCAGCLQEIRFTREAFEWDDERKVLYHPRCIVEARRLKKSPTVTGIALDGRL